MNTKEPPRLPPRLPPVVRPPPPPPAPVDVRFINGIEGLSPEEIKALVGQGGRFVIFQYCISVLVLSFKPSSGLYFLRPDENGFGKSASYSLLSLVAGWWGIPWGPIWTIAALATNLSGGKDMTREVMWSMALPMPAPAAAQDLSPVERAEHEERQRRRSITIAVAWALVAAVFLGMGWLVYRVMTAQPPQTSNAYFPAPTGGSPPPDSEDLPSTNTIAE